MTRTKLQHYTEQIPLVGQSVSFEDLAKEAFLHQRENCPPFREFLDSLPQPFQRRGALPIEAFKYTRVCCTPTEEVIFRSSGTGGQRSAHHVSDIALYARLSQRAFELRFGTLREWLILALLPSYVEQGESSLVFMVNHFIRETHNNLSTFVGFDNHAALAQRLRHICTTGQKILLIGVSFALLDFCKDHAVGAPNLYIMETGGMKGRGRELTRPELHQALKQGFPSSPIWSEYGMTELLSQAYCSDGRWFVPPPWLRAYVTDITDPLQPLPHGQRGALAFVDLANIHSCSFVQTRDIGMVDAQGRFTVEGRIDYSDLRGCNLLYG